MSHEITATDNMVSTNNILPWHGLGTVIDKEAITAAEALKLASLDWDVAQEGIFDADMVEIPTHQINRRTDTGEILGVVSKTWEPLQNNVLLEVAESLTQVKGVDYQPVIETAGSLMGGKLVWALCRIGEREFADSTHKTYLLMSNGHDGKRSLRGTLTDVRVVCNNTLGFAESKGSTLYCNHRSGIVNRLQTSVEALGWATSHTQSTFAIFEALATTKITDGKAGLGFQRLIGVKDGENPTKRQNAKVEQLFDLYRNGPGVNGATAYDFVNAVTDYVDHHKQTNSKMTADRKFFRTSFDGDGVNTKARALAIAKSF